MTAPRPPDDTGRSDEIKQRYLQASAEQAIGPSERVKRAALAHAQTVALAAGEATQVAATAAATRAQPTAIAANRPRWNVPLVASLAIASISALLALQFDRSDPADQRIVLGTPSATTPTGTATRALPPQEPIALPTEQPLALPPQEPIASEQEKLGLPAPEKSPAAPASSPPATKKAKSALALDRQSTMTVPAPASPPAAEPAYVPEPPSAVPRPAPQPSAVAPTGRNAATAKPPVAGSEFADADKSIGSSARGAPQSKAASTADAERSPQAGARSEAKPADSSSATSAAIRGRAASAAQPSPATVSAPSLTPAPAPPLTPPLTPPPTPSPTREVAPLDAGLALREAARTGQLTLLVEAVRSINAAQLNSTDKAGRTALMLATLGGHAEVVERLLAAGADTELKDTNGQTAAQMARRLGYQQIESALKKR